VNTLLCVALLALAGEAGAAPQGSFFIVELKGGGSVLALDHPMQKGRSLVFHRHPDGVYTSLASDEVARIVVGAAQPRPRKLQPGDVKSLGPMTDEPMREQDTPPQAPAYEPYVVSDYGYWNWGSSGSARPPRPPRPPAPVPTPLPIGPGGYPILAPPGAPGSTPPPIGQNGYPIISPQPPQPNPR